jgi:hypothetical protein
MSIFVGKFKKTAMVLEVNYWCEVKKTEKYRNYTKTAKPVEILQPNFQKQRNKY